MVNGRGCRRTSAAIMSKPRRARSNRRVGVGEPTRRFYQGSRVEAPTVFARRVDWHPSHRSRRGPAWIASTRDGPRRRALTGTACVPAIRRLARRPGRGDRRLRRLLDLGAVLRVEGSRQPDRRPSLGRTGGERLHPGEPSTGGLADYRVVDDTNPAMLAERGDLIDRVTDVIERMLDDVVAVRPTDDKGRRSCRCGRPTTARTSRTAAEFADRPPRRPQRRRSARRRSTGSRSATSSRSSPATTTCPPAPHRTTCRPDHPPDARLPGRPFQSAEPGSRRRITTAGLPAATQLSGISPRTTLLAPITTWRPIGRPGQHHGAVAEPRARRRSAPDAPAATAPRSGRSRSA